MQYECRDRTIKRNFRFPSNNKKKSTKSWFACLKISRTEEGNDDEEQVDVIESSDDDDDQQCAVQPSAKYKKIRSRSS